MSRKKLGKHNPVKYRPHRTGKHPALPSSVQKPSPGANSSVAATLRQSTEPRTSGNVAVLTVWDSFPLDKLRELPGFRHFKWDAKMLVHAKMKHRLTALKKLQEIREPRFHPFVLQLAKAMLHDPSAEVQAAAKATGNSLNSSYSKRKAPYK